MNRIRNYMVVSAWTPGALAVDRAMAPFSWLATKKVCQKWNAYSASFSGELGANAT